MIILWDEGFRQALLREIQMAKKEILIASFKCSYRKTGKARHLDAIIEELVRAEKRGVKIQIILNRAEADQTLKMINLRAMRAMEDKGLLVGWTKPGRRWHGKAVVVDRMLTIIGSHNLSETSLSQNGEISILIEDKEMAEQVAENLGEI